MNPIFLIGYMGSGKSTVGKLLAKKLNLSFVDLDDYIEEKTNKTIAQIFAEKGEAEFRDFERTCLRDVVKTSNTVISTGGGAPCFFDNIDFINLHGISVYLKVEPEILAGRLKSAPGGVRPLIAGLNDDELVKFIEKNLQKREPYYNKAKLIVDGSGNNVAELIEQFLIEK